MKRRVKLLFGAMIACSSISAAYADDDEGRRAARELIMRHVNGFNACDVELLTIISEKTLVLLPNGGVLPPFDVVAEFERYLCGPPSAGGLGIHVSVEGLNVYGDGNSPNTVLLQAKFDSPFFEFDPAAEPGVRKSYRAAYAFVIRNGKVLAEVTTFDVNALPLPAQQP